MACRSSHSSHFSSLSRRKARGQVAKQRNALENLHSKKRRKEVGQAISVRRVEIGRECYRLPETPARAARILGSSAELIVILHRKQIMNILLPSGHFTTLLHTPLFHHVRRHVNLSIVRFL